MVSIKTASELYLEMISLSRSENTTKSYSNAISVFLFLLEEKGVEPNKTDINELEEKAIGWFATYLKGYAPTSEQMYIVAISRFYQFLIAEDFVNLNLQKVKLLIKTRGRKPGIRLPQFPKESIEKVILFAREFPNSGSDELKEKLITYRNSSFILTLADTGLRVHEICNLTRGDIDWAESRGIVIGKGNQQAIIRFSKRSMLSMKAYINLRRFMDGGSSKPLSSLPIYARHDKGAGKNILPISTASGRRIVKNMCKLALGETEGIEITPHSFRHYFVTTVLLGSGGNLKMAQELARHKNIQVTQRYAHLNDDELDKAYNDIFDQ
jgi:integrase/recombinase XerC